MFPSSWLQNSPLFFPSVLLIRLKSHHAQESPPFFFPLMIQKCIASDRFPPTRENPGRVSALRKTRTKAKIPKSVSPPRNPQRSPSAAAVNERRFGLSGVPQHSLLMYYHYLFFYCSDSPAPFEDAVMSLLSSSCLAHTGLVPRCVIIQKDENGFGLTVSGDNPVFVQLVKKGETQKKKTLLKNRERRLCSTTLKGTRSYMWFTVNSDAKEKAATPWNPL